VVEKESVQDQEEVEDMAGGFVTQKGYDVYEVLSALQKAIRRGLEEDALFWATELYKSGMGGQCWNRLLVMVSEDIGVAESHLPATIWALFEIYERLRKGGNGEKTPAILQVVHAVMLMCRARKSRAVDWACCVLDNNEDDHRQIPDFALDKHTRRGRAMGRGFRHFIEVGSLLENEAEEVGDPYREAACAFLLGQEEGEQDGGFNY
jgi:replication-associated recombination protein RarA